MSLLALPIQYINMGGEMLYIIDQRLRAQNIPADRAKKVRNEVLAIMLNNRFMEEILQPQEPYNKGALRSIFEKLAHASIMKMNPASMDKLFELMLMGLKHQLVLCPAPQVLLAITRNHLDALLSYTVDAHTRSQVEQFYVKFFQKYENLSVAAWDMIRNTLLAFVQDIKTRVSIFLKRGIQDHFGHLVLPINGYLPAGAEVPGVIRTFNEDEQPTIVTRFPTQCAFMAGTPHFSTEIPELSTNLGFNLYLDKDDDVTVQAKATKKENQETPSSKELGRDASKELNLLAEIIGSSAIKETMPTVPLNLFTPFDETDTGETAAEKYPGYIEIEGRTQPDPRLNEIMGQLNIENAPSSSKEDDLLDLIDKL